MSKNLSALSGRKGLENNLFERIGKLADTSGTPSQDDMRALSEEFLIGEANIYATVSFYDFLKKENTGIKAYVCNGSACMTAGTQDKVRQHLKEHFLENQIGEMSCLGRCHEGSAFHRDGKNYSGNNAHQQDHYHVENFGTQLLTGTALTIDDCIRQWKECINVSPDILLHEIVSSGLRGRGGAGFPIGIKLESCKNEISESKYIVCNADEGDPGAYSDRYLLEKQPFSVLMGMMIAGYIIGAHDGVLYIRAEYPESIQIIRQLANELMQAIQSEMASHDFSFRFSIIQARGAYICGEETALLNSIEGQRPEVRVRPPYPVQNGLFNKPTVVNNVETLASLPWIIQNTGKSFAAIGTSKSSGTKLISLDSHFNKPGIYEVDMGAPLSYVIDEMGAGFKTQIKAMQIGGPLGGIVPIHKVPELNVDFESFASHGFLLGHASIVCIPENFSMIKYLEHLFKFTAHESCGKCFPCRLGSLRGYEMIKRAVDNQKLMDRNLFDDLVETMELGSLCALGGGLPLPVKNILQYFNTELSAHFTQ